MALGDGRIEKNQIKIIMWNINGLKRMIKKNEFKDFIEEAQPDIICLNETKLSSKSLKEVLSWPVFQSITKDYYLYWNNCTSKKGYSGTAIFTKFLPKAV